MESPKSTEAENEIIASVLINSSCHDDVFELLNRDHFYKTRNRTMFGMCQDRYRRGEPISAAEIASGIGDEALKYITKSDVGKYLDEPTAIDPKWTARILITTATRRKAIELSNALTKAASDNSREISEISRLGQAVIDVVTEADDRQNLNRPQTSCAAMELIKMNIKEVKWVVPDFLPVGYSLLVGSPKMGKSMMALNLALAKTSGGMALGRFPVSAGGVIYYALEDTLRRLQSRMVQMLHGAPAPANLYFITECPRMGMGGLEQIERELKENPGTELVIIDTFAKIKSPMRSGTQAYDHDYTCGAAIKTMADKYNIAVLVVHHDRKFQSEDPFEDVSGTYGVTGAADSVFVLKRSKQTGDIVLHSVGRDIERQSLACSFDENLLLWTITVNRHAIMTHL
jgi:replicative DNA helicase